MQVAVVVVAVNNLRALEVLAVTVAAVLVVTMSLVTAKAEAQTQVVAAAVAHRAQVPLAAMPPREAFLPRTPLVPRVWLVPVAAAAVAPVVVAIRRVAVVAEMLWAARVPQVPATLL